MPQISLIQIDPNVLEDLVESLSQESIEVQFIEGGFGGLALIRPNIQSEFLICIQTYEDLQRISEMKRTSDSSLIFILNDSQNQIDAESAFDAGAAASFLPPFDAFRITQSIKSMIRLRDLGKSTRAPRYWANAKIRISHEGNKFQGELLNFSRGGFFGLFEEWPFDRESELMFEITFEEVEFSGSATARWSRSGMAQFESDKTSRALGDTGVGFEFSKLERTAQLTLASHLMNSQKTMIFPV